ncbi:MAG: aromatic amino acid transport family protein, partial [Nanoarchaeota archaeon]
MKSKFFPALAVLVGTTMGAGFLGIPYVISKSGFLPGLACLIFIAFFMLFVKLYLGEIALRTRGSHQLTGYAERYLGRKGKLIMFFAMLFGIYSALVAYLIAEGNVLSYVFFGNENFSLVFSLFFWLLMAFLTYIGLSELKKAEKTAMFIVWFILLIIALIFFPGIKTENLSYINTENIFIPFGLIIFSFLAFSAMPEVERILVRQEGKMKKVIILGMMIPLIIYFVFTLVIVGNFGSSVPEIATLALPRIFSILAVITMFTAFFTLSIAIRDMFRFDYHMGRFKGWAIACFSPLVLFLLVYFFKLASFIMILSIAGVVSGGLTGILILFMNKNAKEKGNRTPEYSVPINWWIIFILSALFIAAIIAEFVF